MPLITCVSLRTKANNASLPKSSDRSTHLSEAAKKSKGGCSNQQGNSHLDVPRLTRHTVPLAACQAQVPPVVVNWNLDRETLELHEWQLHRVGDDLGCKQGHGEVKAGFGGLRVCRQPPGIQIARNRGRCSLFLVFDDRLLQQENGQQTKHLVDVLEYQITVRYRTLEA